MRSIGLAACLATLTVASSAVSREPQGVPPPLALCAAVAEVTFNGWKPPEGIHRQADGSYSDADWARAMDDYWRKLGWLAAFSKSHPGDEALKSYAQAWAYFQKPENVAALIKAKALCDASDGAATLPVLPAAPKSDGGACIARMSPPSLDALNAIGPLGPKDKRCAALAAVRRDHQQSMAMIERGELSCLEQRQAYIDFGRFDVTMATAEIAFGCNRLG